ncbi:MAG: phosphorylase [Symploca sp. SIO2C1]|nr:phosphorylase [Symploca sp. SIO2C1]
MPEEQPTSQETLTLEPGTLWTSLTNQTAHALQCKALQSIPTESEFVEQDGISFLVRILSNLIRKDKAKQKQDKKATNSAKEFNPFLPYEEDLFVADISNTHLCLLNKFNVVDYHLLIVTRSFEEQETLLTLQDFEAMWRCLAEFEGLAFYNGGKIAGASQRHKHLQFVPLPLASNGLKIPIEPAIASARFKGTIGTIPSFPFVHAVARLDPLWAKSPLEAAAATSQCYHNLLRAVGWQGDESTRGNRQSGAYNLLATRQWMLLVPRSQEDFESISVNSLGFGGALLVRNEQQMQILKDFGPMNILKSVAQSQ